MRAAANLNSRDLILNAARTLIDEKGYDGMAVSELCTASGFPASSIYYHFGSKLGVLAALLERTFEEMHALFPGPGAFDHLAPMERFEAWFSGACRTLDKHPDYLRLLVATGVGPHKDTDEAQHTLRRIRDSAHASWVSALTPIFAPAGGRANKALVEKLAILGRAVTDGLAVANNVDSITYSSEVAAFLQLIRSLAETRSS
ncbi:hypothetical protein GCM10009745_71470 [Kribbella yunnanensis]|uniref:HTH tetR-type domain-containing protein n=1 Tax=Kribbella yunnanensis TaxID=190194 RepID=A0ABN2IW03_9ACTN